MGAILCALALVGCTEQAAQTTYVGKVPGTDTFVAFVTDGETAIAYTCGGEDGLHTQTEWFMGDVWMDEQAIVIDCGHTAFFAHFTAEGIEGTFIDNALVPRKYAARPIRPGSIEGLYHVDDPTCDTGAIVIQDDPNAPPQIRGAWCNGAGVFRQVTPMFNPIEMTDRGLPLSIEFDDPLPVYASPFDL